MEFTKTQIVHAMVFTMQLLILADKKTNKWGHVLLSNFSSSNMFFIRLFLARLREKENLFRYRASLRKISYVLHVHALMCARWWRENRA